MLECFSSHDGDRFTQRSSEDGIQSAFAHHPAQRDSVVKKKPANIKALFEISKI